MSVIVAPITGLPRAEMATAQSDSSVMIELRPTMAAANPCARTSSTRKIAYPSTASDVALMTQRRNACGAIPRALEREMC